MTVEPLPRPDWRESVALAADLALVGIAVTVGCLTVVGAGAVLVTASVAVDQAATHRSFPPVRHLLGTLRHALLPGIAALLIAAVPAGLLILDALALSSGRVPGGPPLLIATGLVAAAGVATAGITLVRLGQTGGRGYLPALRFAVALLARRPLVAVAVVPTVAAPVLLAMLVPATAPLLPGFAMFGLHAVARRLGER
jgi:hypothetical protein